MTGSRLTACRKKKARHPSVRPGGLLPRLFPENGNVNFREGPDLLPLMIGAPGRPQNSPQTSADGRDCSVLARPAQRRVLRREWEIARGHVVFEADSRKFSDERPLQEIAELKDFVARNKARVATRNMAMSRQKKLDNMDIIELAAEKPKPEFNFKTARTPGRYIFQTHDLVIGYDEPLSSPLNLEMERGQKIVLTGANGIGKSTLLKSILGLIKPLSGDVEQGDYLEIGYFEQETPAGIETTCLEEIWQEFPGFTQYEVRSALAKCGLTTKHIESKVKVLSGGEQAKVRLCKLINRESNILLLDEPTNHLDVDAKAELKRALKEYKGSILMVCHEPEFYENLATEVWDCSQWSTRA